MSVKIIALDRLLDAISERPRGEFALLIGSGASRTSGIWTADEIVRDLLRDMYLKASKKPRAEKERLKYDDVAKWAQQQDWFGRRGSESEYSVVMHHAFLTDYERKEYLDRLCDQRNPSAGYRSLAHLLSEGWFSRVLTPNFDNLVYDASNRLNVRRVTVVDNSEAFKCAALRDPRAQVYRLHGDFKYNNLKNTDQQTRALDADVRGRFREILREHALIVVGYSGRDISIMREELLAVAEDSAYLQRGCYWCRRPGSALSELAREFVDKCPNAMEVEIQNFDALMEAVAAKVNLSLPMLPDEALGGPVVVAAVRTASARSASDSGSASDQLFESRPVPGTTLQDLDIDLLRREALGKDPAQPVYSEKFIEDFAEKNSLAERDGAALRPTHAGVLLFGKNPAQFVRHGFIKAAEFHEHDRLAQQDISGRLGEQIAAALGFVMARNRRQTVVGGQSVEIEEYPKLAVREAVVNAIVHRDYGKQGIPIHLYLEIDKLIVTSPGGLIPGVRADLLGQAKGNRGSRNQTLMFFLRSMGFVEELGTGIIRIYREMRKNGSPDPVFRITADSFEVILPKRKLPEGPVEADGGRRIKTSSDLTINAFRAATIPGRMWRAETFHTEQRKVKGYLWQHKLGYGHLSGGALYFIGDPKKLEKYAELGLKGAPEEVRVGQDVSRERTIALMAILNQALFDFLTVTLGFQTNRRGKYFLVSEQLGTERTIAFKGLSRTWHRKVVSRWGPSGTRWVNQGVSCKIEHVNQWFYLIVNPTAVMTSDGIRISSAAEQRTLTKMLAKRFNSEYRSFLNYFVEFLSQGKGRIVVPVAPGDVFGSLIFDTQSNVVRMANDR